MPQATLLSHSGEQTKVCSAARGEACSRAGFESFPAAVRTPPARGRLEVRWWRTTLATFFLDRLIFGGRMV